MTNAHATTSLAMTTYPRHCVASLLAITILFFHHDVKLTQIPEELKTGTSWHFNAITIQPVCKLWQDIYMQWLYIYNQTKYLLNKIFFNLPEVQQFLELSQKIFICFFN
jgi:hypothetical protein